ncbi:MAG: hypothetical protein NVSMB9_14810 [Isosphaeraceae bacterium]
MMKKVRAIGRAAISPLRMRVRMSLVTARKGPVLFRVGVRGTWGAGAGLSLIRVGSGSGRKKGRGGLGLEILVN